VSAQAIRFDRPSPASRRGFFFVRAVSRSLNAVANDVYVADRFSLHDYGRRAIHGPAKTDSGEPRRLPHSDATKD
jgi:hypothetical protein